MAEVRAVESSGGDFGDDPDDPAAGDPGGSELGGGGTFGGDAGDSAG